MTVVRGTEQGNSFEQGDRVILKEDVQRGWKEEHAEVLEYQGMHNDGTHTYMVLLDPKYRNCWDDTIDDGLREVTEDQMRRE